MAERVVVIGAGVIGAAAAYRLARAGRAVTVVDAGSPGAAATGHSYGWINASFHLDHAHFRLRVEAIAAWHRLQREVAGLSVAWPGCLLWEAPPADLERQAAALEALDYPVALWDRGRVAREVPAVAPPELALFFSAEGVAEGRAVVAELLAAAGVKVLAGCRVTEVETAGGRVSGVRVPGGRLAADRVLVAAGVAAGDLVAPFGVEIPLLYRPAVMMRTAPVPPCLPVLAVAPGLEIRQQPSGHILAPTTPNHQADQADTLAEDPATAADRALEVLRGVLPGQALAWDRALFAVRPMPGDGRPVVGPAGPEGLYVAVMHSGVTLAALMGEEIAAEMTGGRSAWLAPYRPARFARAGAA